MYLNKIFPGFNVWCNNKIVRKEGSVNHPDFQDSLNLLKEKYPNFIDYQKYSNSVIGRYIPYRPPYNNEGISFYMAERPTQEIINQWTLNVKAEELANWYGYKFNLDTYEVMIKFNHVYPSRKIIRYNHLFYKLYKMRPDWTALTYRSNGVMIPKIDFYILRPEREEIERLSQFENIPMPCTDENILNNCSLWGLVYDITKNKFTTIKAYENLHHTI